VKITVVQPTNIFVDLEKAIEERFGIRQAIVVDVGENASYSQVKHAIGSAAAHYVETRLRPEDLWGSRPGAVRSAVWWMRCIRRTFAPPG
jgi:DNA-binding transcriptional regulator LsrR (DeoR family)